MAMSQNEDGLRHNLRPARVLRTIEWCQCNMAPATTTTVHWCQLSSGPIGCFQFHGEIFYQHSQAASREEWVALQQVEGDVKCRNCATRATRATLFGCRSFIISQHCKLVLYMSTWEMTDSLVIHAITRGWPDLAYFIVSGMGSFVCTGMWSYHRSNKGSGGLI